MPLEGAGEEETRALMERLDMTQRDARHLGDHQMLQIIALARRQLQPVPRDELPHSPDHHDENEP